MGLVVYCLTSTNSENRITSYNVCYTKLLRPDSLELLHQLARGEGFGKIAGTGVRKMKELFIEKYGADPKFLQDIGMENKGLEYSQYVSKESLAQQGGYAMTNKGPQHDEAWLIFLDMVNNMIPTFDNKAEALHFV